MKSHEKNLEKKKVKKGYLRYSASKYVFKVKVVFRDCTRTEAYLGHCQTRMMELFCENS